MPRDAQALAHARARSRNPLTAAEFPHAEALGRLLRSLRAESGYTAQDVALYSELSRNQLYNIESATRRTRASTLARLGETYGYRLRVDPAQLTARLVETAGIAVAAETNYPEHVNSRRHSRAVKNEMLADRRAYYGSILRELRRKTRPARPAPLRGPDGRWLPQHPTPEQIAELERRYKALQMVMPPRDASGDFITESPYLDNRMARYWFNPPKLCGSPAGAVGERPPKLGTPLGASDPTQTTR